MTYQLVDLNHYSLLDEIENSSTSELYMIKENRTGEIFAAKISINIIDCSNYPNYMPLTKICNMQQINHPSILKYIGFSTKNFQNENKPVIISQYIPNKSLESILYKDTNLVSSSFWNDTLKLINIYGIASAMSYLHSHNIIHKYLYPTNILMDYRMFPKIADFQPFTFHNLIKDALNDSTIIYSAPELYNNQESSKESDVYAFGMIVYSIITNERPFKNSTFSEIQAQVASGHRPDVPPEIAEPYSKLIEQCWSQESSERPTFDEITNLLRNEAGFITDKIDKQEFVNYVEYLDEYQRTHDKSSRGISYEEFIESKMNILKKIQKDENEKKFDDKNIINDDLFGNEKDELFTLSSQSDKKQKKHLRKKEPTDLFGPLNKSESVDLLENLDKNKEFKPVKEKLDNESNAIKQNYTNNNSDYSNNNEALNQTKSIDYFEYLNKGTNNKSNNSSNSTNSSKVETNKLSDYSKSIDGLDSISTNHQKESAESSSQVKAINFFDYPNKTNPNKQDNFSNSANKELQVDSLECQNEIKTSE